VFLTSDSPTVLISQQYFHHSGDLALTALVGLPLKCLLIAWIHLTSLCQCDQ